MLSTCGDAARRDVLVAVNALLLKRLRLPRSLKDV
jgi:hypothetical protein